MRAVFLLAAVSLSSGCGVLGLNPTDSRTTPAVAPVSSGLGARGPEDAPKNAESAPDRPVGELTIHRFAGSYRARPMIVTEEVIARDGAGWLLDVSFDDGGVLTKFRVRMDAYGEPLAASLSNGDRFVPGSLAAYQAFVEKTAFAADRNDGLIDTQSGTCLIGPEELACETKRYRVSVAGKPATLSVTSSAALPDRDISGEILSADGKLLYRSELMERRSETPSSSVARK